MITYHLYETDASGDTAYASSIDTFSTLEDARDAADTHAKNLGVAMRPSVKPNPMADIGETPVEMRIYNDRSGCDHYYVIRRYKADSL
jgi:hypothetical protein